MLWQPLVKITNRLWYKLLYIVIFQRKDNKEGELNIHTDINISNRMKLWFKILINSECTYTEINKQLVKEE